MCSAKKQGACEDAAELIKVWQHAHPELEAERLRDLRELTEQDAAQRFALLLRMTKPYPLRKTSGLVEQQRIFARLR